MRRVFAIILGLGVVLLAGGFLSLGAFPPKPVQQPVHKVISNDTLGGSHA